MNIRVASFLVLCLLGSAAVAKLAMQSSGQEQVVALPATSDREVKIEFELRRLRDLFDRMGENHPHLKLTQQRISELQAELLALSREPGPIARALVVDRADAEKMVQQMSEQEMKQAVLHLFGEVQDLKRRLDAIEQRGK